MWMVLLTPPKPDVSFCSSWNMITVYCAHENEIILLSQIEGQGPVIVQDCKDRLWHCFLGYDVLEIVALVDSAHQEVQNT